jgi:hypothetical protein
MNKCDAISDNMTAYRNLYYYLEGTFDGCEVLHVSRASNEEANNLTNIESQCVGVLDTGVSRSTCSWPSSTAQLRPRGETTTEAGGEDPHEEAPHEENEDQNR